MNATPSSCQEIRFLPVESVPGLKRGAGRRIMCRAFLLGFGGMVTVTIAIAIATLIQESRRNGCDANLKRLGLALHDYHEAHGHFPAPAIVSTAGTPLLSWRVALLPQLGYQTLYARFHLDEPWDSPHNRSLVAEIPTELACPGGYGRRKGQTDYRVIVGPKFDPYSVNTPFNPDRGVEIREMTDGTSNTILVVETDSRRPVDEARRPALGTKRPIA